MTITLHPPTPVTLRRRRPDTAAALAVAAAVALALVLFAASMVGRSTSDAAASVADGASPALDARDRTSLGLADGVDTFFAPGAAGAVVERLAAAVDSEGGRLTQVRLYPDRVFVTARSADRRVAGYAWVAGSIVPSEPAIVFGGDVGAFLAFDADAVAWERIAELVSAAPTLAGVHDGVVSHVTVDRTTLDPALPLTIRINVTGPNGNGLVEVSAAGEVIAIG
ncbi:MAG: hypothetical protein NTZ21_04600 [Actinobacteria bacterium]|nr:hypothetical protein [Actinomycetota bacterium]